MLEKRQKSKAPPAQQLDLVESISQVDKLLIKRRLIGAVMGISILASLFFMFYGQVLKGKKLDFMSSLPTLKINLPAPPGSSLRLSTLSLPSSFTYTIKFIDYNQPSPKWVSLTPSATFDFSPPSDLKSLLLAPDPQDPIVSLLPSGLNVSHHQTIQEGSLAYFISFTSPRQQFILAYKFIATDDQIKSLKSKLPQIVESNYWEIISQL